MKDDDGNIRKYKMKDDEEKDERIMKECMCRKNENEKFFFL